MASPLISIVDDDDSVRESLEGLLRSVGIAVESFESAEAFLAAGADMRAECLILDISMPGMTGPELQQELAERGNHVPIIFITARADKALIARLLERGSRACLVKPFDEVDLLEAVRGATNLDFARWPP